jgi:hypothetical protein
MSIRYESLCMCVRPFLSMSMSACVQYALSVIFVYSYSGNVVLAGFIYVDYYVLVATAGMYIV